MKFYDTNALLELQSAIFEDEFAISSESLKELENIKTANNKDQGVKFNARQIARMLLERQTEYTVCIVDKTVIDTVEEFNLPCNSDNLICACAYLLSKTKEVEFISYDVACNLIASNIFGLNIPINNSPTLEELEYKGFKCVYPTDEEYIQLYEKENSENIFNCKINEYVIFKDKEDNVCDIACWTGTKYRKIFDKHIKTLMFDKIKAKDIYQRMAIDSLVNNQMTCISGKAGSGKTLLALMTAMYLIETGKYDRLVVLFNPCPVRGTTQMGYYAGNMIEKSLQTNIGHIFTTKFGDKFAIDNYIAQGKIKLLPMADCRGSEITDNEILWITEAENTSADLMKICLSRVSSQAKVIIEGDYDQIDSVAFERNNGMLRAIEVFSGDEMFGYVQLQNVWRSHIAELADKL